MRETFIDDSITHRVYLPEQEKTLTLERRQFMQTIAGAGLGLGLAPKLAFAQSYEYLWRDRVTKFIYAVCEDDKEKAEAINSQLLRASIIPRNATTDFHYSLSAPFVFYGITIEAKKVICGNAFAVNRFPLYDSSCPCGEYRDLNAFEIITFTHRWERERFGCIHTPLGERVSPETHSNHADYRKTVTEDYGKDLNRVRLDSIRNVSGAGKRRFAYGVTNTETNGKPILGANGKPVRDVFLSSEDW